MSSRKPKKPAEAAADEPAKRIVLATDLPGVYGPVLRLRIAQTGAKNTSAYLRSLVRADIGLPEKEEGTTTE